MGRSHIHDKLCKAGDTAHARRYIWYIETACKRASPDRINLRGEMEARGPFGTEPAPVSRHRLPGSRGDGRNPVQRRRNTVQSCGRINSQREIRCIRHQTKYHHLASDQIPSLDAIVLTPLTTCPSQLPAPNNLP